MATKREKKSSQRRNSRPTRTESNVRSIPKISKGRGLLSKTALLKRLRFLKINRISSPIRTVNSAIGQYNANFWRDDEGFSLFVNRLKEPDDGTPLEIMSDIQDLLDDQEIAGEDKFPDVIYVDVKRGEENLALAMVDKLVEEANEENSGNLEVTLVEMKPSVRPEKDAGSTTMVFRFKKVAASSSSSGSDSSGGGSDGDGSSDSSGSGSDDDSSGSSSGSDRSGSGLGDDDSGSSSDDDSSEDDSDDEGPERRGGGGPPDDDGGDDDDDDDDDVGEEDDESDTGEEEESSSEDTSTSDSGDDGRRSSKTESKPRGVIPPLGGGSGPKVPALGSTSSPAGVPGLGGIAGFDLSRLGRDEVPKRKPMEVNVEESGEAIVRNFMKEGDHSLPDNLSDEQLRRVVVHLEREGNEELLTNVYKRILTIAEKNKKAFNEAPANEKERAFFNAIRLAVYSKLNDSEDRPKTVEPLTNSDGKEAKGNVSEVFLATYSAQRLKDEQAVLKVLEEKLDEQKRGFGAAVRVDLNPEFPMILERNLFTSRLHDNVGDRLRRNLGVMVRTTVGKVELPGRRGEQLVLKMERVQGETGIEWKGRYEKLSPDEKAIVAQDLTRMQYFDFLLTQFDRNPGNYILAMNEDGEITGVVAIDNDFSATSDVKYKNQGEDNSLIEIDGGALKGVYLMKLPSIADRTTHEFFMNMTDNDIEDAAKGLLTDQQIEILKVRLQMIKDHLNQDQDKVTPIIEDNEWSDASILKRVERKPGTLAETYVDILRNMDKGKQPVPPGDRSPEEIK